MKPGKRVTDPKTGETGKVVFISPINHLIYVEFDRKLPFVMYRPGAFGGDLFAPL